MIGTDGSQTCLLEQFAVIGLDGLIVFFPAVRKFMRPIEPFDALDAEYGNKALPVLDDVAVLVCVAGLALEPYVIRLKRKLRVIPRVLVMAGMLLSAMVSAA